MTIEEIIAKIETTIKQRNQNQTDAANGRTHTDHKQNRKPTNN